MGRRKGLNLMLPPGVRKVSAKGRDYFYFHARRGTAAAGKPIRIPGLPHEAEFWRTLQELGCERPDAGTVAALVRDYRASPEFDRLADQTRRIYDHYLDLIEEAWGKFPAGDIRPSHVILLRDELVATPVAANHLLSVIRLLFKWAVPREYAQVNPAREVDRFPVEHKHAKPWPDWAFDLIATHARDEVRIAVAFGRYTGQRLADIMSMSLAQIQGGVIDVRQSKTGKFLRIPVHAELVVTVEECRKRAKFYLLPRRSGQPLTAELWQSMWTKEVRKEGLRRIRTEGLSFHGLRAGAATKLKDIGCSDAEIQSITGMSKPMIEQYTKHLDQAAAARRAMTKWEAS